MNGSSRTRAGRSARLAPGAVEQALTAASRSSGANLADLGVGGAEAGAIEEVARAVVTDRPRRDGGAKRDERRGERCFMVRSSMPLPSPEEACAGSGRRRASSGLPCARASVHAARGAKLVAG
jgi:hypothetical protein